MKKTVCILLVLLLACCPAMAEGREAVLRFAGDVMVTETMLTGFEEEGGTYDFTGGFSCIAPYLADADLTVVNLETTIGLSHKMGYTGYPQFNSPSEVLDALVGCGVDMLTLANNHMLDRWADGVVNTVDAVEEKGLLHVGAYRTPEERQTPVIVEVQGIKFGFLAYTQSTNTMENYCDKNVLAYEVPSFRKADMAGDVARLREAGAEIVICFAHWGAEYIRKPDSDQKTYAARLAEAGVDIIIGGHSHVVQGTGRITTEEEDGTSRETLVLWSLGNFISTQTKSYTDSGVICEITVTEKDDGSLAYGITDVIPTYCWQSSAGAEACVTVLPCRDYPENGPGGMTQKAFARLRAAEEETLALFEE